MKFNILKRFQNRAFCVSFVSTCILLLQQIGLGGFLPDNIIDIINTCLTILCMLGVIIDPTTPGINDSELALSSKTSDELLLENEELKKELENK